MKKITAILLAGVMMLGTLNGCGAGKEQGLTVSGTLNEVKDFMFIIETADGAFYSFPRSEDGVTDLSEISVGDEITVEYEGTISEIDGFEGKVLSVEKQ